MLITMNSVFSVEFFDPYGCAQNTARKSSSAFFQEELNLHFMAARLRLPRHTGG
eukprot:TRINITY_DN2823_c0_g1_i1.p2 TRINITY_DN2823_c0_g1~~TRINITY_DN2823_c0_g1_i1.p2  ORF type:complete len:54 (+),score=11.06 TRINITY_DN2823_c0_g1_i1:127-288(+)